MVQITSGCKAPLLEQTFTANEAVLPRLSKKGKKIVGLNNATRNELLVVGASTNVTAIKVKKRERRTQK